MDRRQLYAALRHHPRRDRAVETAADEDRRAPAGADRIPPAPGFVSPWIYAPFSRDLNAHNDVRLCTSTVRCGFARSRAPPTSREICIESSGNFCPRASIPPEGLDIHAFPEVLRRSLEESHPSPSGRRTRACSRSRRTPSPRLGSVDVRVRILRRCRSSTASNTREVAGTLDTPPIFLKSRSS